MIKVVIFDLDDTLISEKQYIESGYKVVAKKVKEDYRLDNLEYDIYTTMLNMFTNNSKNVFNRLLDYYKLNYSDEYIKELVDAYRNHIPNITFFYDVIPFIKELKDRNIKTGIISDGYINTQKNKLNVLKAKEIFDKIILTDELGKEYWKPCPKAFEIMKDYFNVEYEEMMYIGDNPKKDFYIRNYHPITTVRIYRGNSVYANVEYLENIKEDYKISNLNEIFNIIKNK